MGPELGSNLEQNIRNRLIETMTSCWIEAFCSGEYALLEDSFGGNCLYQFDRSDEDRLSRYFCGIEANAQSETITPYSIAVSKRECKETEIVVEEFYINPSRGIMRHRAQRMGYDQLDRKDPAWTVGQFKWKKARIGSLHRLNTEILSSELEPLRNN